MTQPVLIPGQQLSTSVPWERDDSPPPAWVRHALPKGNALDARGVLDADPISGLNLGGCQVIRRLAGNSDHTLLALRDTVGEGLVPVVMRLLEGDELLQREVASATERAMELEHANLARTFPCEFVERGAYWVTAMVSGATLAEISDACVKAGKSVPVGIALAAVHEAALALSELHGAGREAHGLICDRSLVIGFDGSARVLDVGLAQAMQHQRQWSEVLDRLTPYLSPEQVMRGHMADPRSDVFALAALLHAFLSAGRTLTPLPFDSRAKLHRHGGYPPPSSLNVSLSTRLDAVLMKALSEDPMQRYATANEFAMALKSAASELFWRRELRAQFVGQLFGDRKRREEVLFAATSSDSKENAMGRSAHDRTKTPPWAQPAHVPAIPKKQVKTSVTPRRQYQLASPTPKLVTRPQPLTMDPFAAFEAAADDIPFAESGVEEVWEDDGEAYDEDEAEAEFRPSKTRPVVLALIAAALGWFYVQGVPLDEVPRWAPAKAAALERAVRPHIFPVTFWSPAPIFAESAEHRAPSAEQKPVEPVAAVHPERRPKAEVEGAASPAVPFAPWEPLTFADAAPIPPQAYPDQIAAAARALKPVRHHVASASKVKKSKKAHARLARR
jgi:serine/threonine protein kinase